MDLPPKPQPTVDAWTLPYWQAARAGRLLIQQCRACGRFIFYPRQSCPFCFRDEPAWVESSGRGTVYSFTVVENNAPSAFAGDLPFVIAVVQLEEGVRMLTNLVGCDPAAVRCDLPVEVIFEPLTAEITLPKFKPREA
jgi:uncharacterized OB-fold protein